MSDFNFLKVAKVDRLTRDSVALSFEVPNELKKDYGFISGQYLTLEVVINELKVRRSYSICSGPRELLKVGIKKVKGGLFSNYIVDKIQTGDLISVAIPQGRFLYNSKGDKELITGIAAGSGITPILSIAKHVLDANNENEFRLIYGNKSLSSEMFSQEIESLKELYPSRLKVVNVYSQSNEKQGIYGRIDISIITYYREKYNIADKYYICGPESMINSISDVLLKEEVPKNKIFYELFTASNISVIEKSNARVSKLDIVYDGETYCLENVSGKTVLEVAIQNEVDVPYSCQGGVCSSCIAKVVEGGARMRANQVLTEEEVEEGIILTCQAEVKEDYAKVDFDDI